MAKNIALFGGRFDPPHLGHLLVARQIAESVFGIDEVWLVPSFQHPWKHSIASVNHRVAMTNYLAEKHIKISLIEVELGGISYTIRTVRELTKRFAHQFFWVMGSDGLVDFEKWKDVKKLVKMIPFIVFPRSGYRVKQLPPYMRLFPLKNPITISLSSSIVRERIRKHLSVTGLVLPEVEKYIQRHKLYEQ